MGGTISMFYSSVVEAAAGTIVTGVVSSVNTTCEMQEALDFTLYSLQQEVIKIECVIDAARRRRISDPKFSEFMASLINAVCLGNYYLRTFRCKNLHHEMIASEGTSNLAAISPTYRAAKHRRTIKTLKNLLSGDEDHSEKLNNVLKKLKCIDTVTFMLLVNSYPERPIKTYLYMDHNRLFNRDKERDQVMRFLFEPRMAGKNNVDMLPIVGPPGVGKTSLALHCSYDPRVKNHFPLRIYINESSINHSIYYSIYKEIMNHGISTKITPEDKNTLIVMLKQILSSERFLLVIDNIWYVDPIFWNDLLDCLRCGKAGSKVILIFTLYRYKKYKKIIKQNTVKPMTFYGFSEEDYMLFFKEHAFGSADPDDYPELEKIGREIATEMNGSIWGAKIFGELLRDNLNVAFWFKFLHEGILKKKIPLEHDLDDVVEVVSQILPKRLPIKYGICSYSSHTGDELKSYRELMVLGPDHCSPVNKYGSNRLDFLLTKHIFLNECTIVTGKLYLE